MPSKTLPIAMARTVAFRSLAPGRKVIVCGAPASGLVTYIAARAACERQSVRVICGDNRFDPYAVARFAKRKGVGPEAALDSILIARAFTAYQLAELINRLDARSSAGPVLITGPCTTLFDEEVPAVDAARLFYRVLWRVVELARGGMTLFLAQGDLPKGMRRAYFLKDLCAASDVVLNCDSVHTFRLEQRRPPALPRLAALDRLLGD
ncbi:MAG TPA: hypothetical protein VJZ91_01680 [Blastocatellia bacterium]|nr:hypothetical protein [Blastocatellia bacterium]